MPDNNVENIVIEHLRAIRAKQARHDQKFEDVLARLGHLERGMTRLHGEYSECLSRHAKPFIA